MQELLSILNFLSPEAKFTVDEPLASKTTLGVGGKAKFYLEPANTQDIRIALEKAQELKIPLFILGRGSNTLVLDEGFDGLVIRLHHSFWHSMEVIGDTLLKVKGGARLKAISALACRLGWSGFEFLEGIPGTLGGALCMNAGAMDSWISDIVSQVECMDHYGKIYTLKKEECGFQYRHSDILKHRIILEATLLKKANHPPPNIQITMDTYSQKRKASQPREASAGCAFKNHPTQSAGKLVENAGLKGSIIGNAQISNVHANFIVNTGNASSNDIIGLITLAQSQVCEKTGIQLYPEVVIMGKDWKDILNN